MGTYQQLQESTQHVFHGQADETRDIDSVYFDLEIVARAVNGKDFPDRDDLARAPEINLKPGLFDRRRQYQRADQRGSLSTLTWIAARTNLRTSAAFKRMFPE